ncbi:MAG: response regulator containing a CheY-like receiver domain and an DNA-binding domain [Clostridia bacterium]|nr:response regulator containing a CheY-like receiver domain and an DNA-binding domain [Clostridia bacterium]
MAKIRVIVADDSDFVRDGLKIIFELDDEFEVVGTAASGKEAVELATMRKTDIVLMDLEMPVMDGIEATKQITAQSLAKVLVLTTFDDDERIQKALLNGAKGYLIKNHTPDKIKQMLKALYSGGNVLDECIFDKITQMGQFKNMSFDESLFTQREGEIIRAVSEGLSNKEIAQKLFISEGTVKNHISAVLDKADLTHRTQIAVYYLTGKK